MNTKTTAISALIAAMYATLVALLPTVSFLLWQVRIADALLMLSTTLGWPAVVGVTLGCFLGNLTAPWGSALLTAIDATLGSVANFIASYLAYRIAYKANALRKAAAASLEIAIITVIVGGYLKYLMLWAFNTDIPLWLSMLGVLPGSIISIGILGTALVIALERYIQVRGVQ
ncbi:MAG: QueT transporter family protein [Thermofilaceae archaeon]|nr:QueT transporter family protein [Thermofilaceae archaeon]MCX8181325.1 QueT transporter family protein [Thermofilaceae archaeon]MDW8003568.1 QueT transporter family protein [Thermofilaceae archaeon]